MPVENIVWAHQREYYAAINEASTKCDAGPFIDFMLDKILRALKAKGKPYEAFGREKSDRKSRQKSDQKIIAMLKRLPTATIVEMADATGMSCSGVKKILGKLKDANRIRRVGPDKGGHWEVNW